VSIKPSTDSELVLPIQWSDNDVTLWPGESMTLTARFATLKAATAAVEVSGWNLAPQRVPLGIETRTAAQETNH
jgi:exo-1,4-beta-D-glucosaminidase